MNEQLLTKKKWRDRVVLFLIMVIVGSTMYALSLKQYTIISDLEEHIQSANDMLAGTVRISYPGWHLMYGFFNRCFGIPENHSAALANTCFSLLCAAAIYWCSNSMGKLEPAVKCCIVLVMTFVGPIYFPVFGENYYLGQGSFNAWHSPTNNAVKFLAVLVFYLFVYTFHVKDASITIAGKACKKTFLQVLLGMATALSLFFKPSFFQVFAPMLAVVFVVDFICERRPLKDYICAGAVYLPSVAIILYQMVDNLLSTEAISKGGGMEIAFLEVWSKYSNNILLSIVAASAFPIFVCVFCERNLFKNKVLLYSWILYGISILEYLFLAEAGERKYHGNLSWGMNIAIGIVFLSSILTFIRYIRDNGQIKSKHVTVKSAVGTCLLLLHFVEGMWCWYYLMFVTRNQYV